MVQQTMQSLFEQEKQGWLDECRTVAKDLLKRKESITSEDVLRVCPRPSYLHRNTTGLIFQNSSFKAVGFTRAKHKEANGRWIRQWKLK